ncbi:GNAT family N-acetyltransferase [Cupriavidus sp. MP-37]|uniref:GNAT family N-acetyltransferase n=1 Tax=Cupriavidus sp. MP-37 TaxID=2884455 RepID=UPI001D0A327C|nr:GNAT family protein [Cupriavidus sp. MP-37]UDM48871.1 GNAT family N-acetyltransferase [Cupriavidus sp. MP-37]
MSPSPSPLRSAMAPGGQAAVPPARRPATPIPVPQYGTPAGAPLLVETGDFLLRSLVPADANERFLAWLGNEEMLRGLNLPLLNFTLPELADFIAGFDNQRNYLVGIFDKRTRLLIGFYTVDVNLAHKVGHLTTGIGENAYWGKGVLWATIDALLDHFYLYRDVDKMVARILGNNRRMLFNFIDNTRFVFEARLRGECLSLDGKRLDVLVFASFRT